jgi:hypothetical protein
MTMHPDPWPPRHASRLGIHIASATPKPRHMEKLNADPMRPIFDDDRESRGSMIVAALAGWAFIAAIVGVMLVVL